jgi:hypothetical protein
MCLYFVLCPTKFIFSSRKLVSRSKKTQFTPCPCLLPVSNAIFIVHCYCLPCCPLPQSISTTSHCLATHDCCLCLTRGFGKKNVIFKMAPIPLRNVTNCSNMCQDDITKALLKKITRTYPLGASNIKVCFNSSTLMVAYMRPFF